MTRLASPPFTIALLMLLLPSQARAAADLRLHYSALQRLLSEQAFTQEGRRYVKGSKDSRCSYGYLERPQVDAVGDRLRIRARFSGRSALDIFGRCVGFGDDFDLTILAVPHSQDGAIRFRHVEVTPARTGFYAGRVCRALQESLPAQFSFPVAQEARRALGGSDPSGYHREFRRFEVTRIVVTAEALVLTLDFDLDIVGPPGAGRDNDAAAQKPPPSLRARGWR